MEIISLHILKLEQDPDPENKFHLIQKIDHLYNPQPLPKSLKRIKKLITRRLHANSPYHYCQHETIVNVMRYLDDYNSFQAWEKAYGECCVCLEDKELMFQKCQHPLCEDCFVKLDQKTCPICRGQIHRVILSPSYVILVLGQPTHYYRFENGGYKFVDLLFFPEYEKQTHVRIQNIYYHENNPSRRELLDCLDRVDKQSYTLVLDNAPEVNKWLKHMDIKLNKPRIEM